MAIIANIHNPKQFEEADIIQMIRRGGFRLIELLWERAGRTHKTNGCSNIIVDLLEGMREPKITESFPGYIKWKRDKFGTVSAFIHKSPYNMEFLASHFRYDHWKIMDQDIRDEVKKMSDKLWASFSPDKRKFEEQKIKDSKRTRRDEEPFVKPKKSMYEDTLVEDNVSLQAKIKELEAEKKDMAKKEKPKSSKGTRKPSEMALLFKEAKELGLKFKFGIKMPELKAAISAAKAKITTPQEKKELQIPEAVT